MKFWLFRPWLTAITMGGMIVQLFLANQSPIHAGIVRLANKSAPSAQKSSQTKAGKGSNVWDDKVYVPPPQRRPVTNHAPQHKKVIQKVPRLTFEWRILKCEPGGVDKEVSPETIFHENDHWRLAIKANQPGFLYVINQTEGPDGSIVDGPRQIFPDSRILNAQHKVNKDEEHILPPRCSPERERLCGCRWYFDKLSGRETLLIIFSRELLTDLADNRAAGDLIKPGYVAQLKNRWENQKKLKNIRQTSKPDLSTQRGNSERYAIWVTNDDLKNNEELIWVIFLANAGKIAGGQ